VHALVTQNVDRLHQRAGSEPVIDLHGRLDVVVCLRCSDRISRDDLQRRLLEANPRFAGLRAPAAPDGDADLEVDLDGFEVPSCGRCGGMLKPDVVFFGESVPKPTVEASFRALDGSDAVLVVGSSLMVWSGFRFARAAAEAGKPIAAVNRGVTRADDRLALKVDADCGDVLRRVAATVAPDVGT
jgi:NAD-dependent SIR2 family protein deacetylase